MKIAYTDWNPRSDTVDLVDHAETVIVEYEADGYTLTLRQLYYQFVARGLVENTVRSYSRLVSIMTKARMSGMISWSAIEDRNRNHNDFWYDEDELNAIYDLPRYLRFDRWGRQDYYVEVWVEKEALGNVVSRACEKYYVPHMACKGYLSASEAWRAGQRYLEKIEEGKNCILIHLGDHDPSGLDMTRDNSDRIDIFTEMPGEVSVTRLALNIDQVNKHKPPPNPAKETDSRFKQYKRMYGDTSWELDALEPKIIERLITSEIEKYIDWNLWDSVGYEETEKREVLKRLYTRWTEIKKILL